MTAEASGSQSPYFSMSWGEGTGLEYPPELSPLLWPPRFPLNPHVLIQ